MNAKKRNELFGKYRSFDIANRYTDQEYDFTIRYEPWSGLKGPSHQIRFAWKWYGSLGLSEDM